MKKIIIMITHSLGELDIIFPLFAGIKAKYDVDVEIIFAVKKIYNQFKNNKFYDYCTKKMDIKITYLQLPNKFDYREGFYKSRIGRLLVRLYFVILGFRSFFYLWPKLYQADVYMHEFSNQILSTKCLYWFNDRFGKKIFVYHHGHAIDMDKIVTSKTIYASQVAALVFHTHSKRYFYDQGFTKQFIIGYPKFFSEWHELLYEYDSDVTKINSCVLILSRHVHPFYMDEDKYKKLLLSSLKIIRSKMGDIEIVIKPHPRESTGLMKNVIKENDISNCTISHENATILAKQAKLAISFWGSVILDPLSMGIPAIEYFIEADRFREVEPEGSAYKKVGIHSTDNELGLEQFIDSVIENKYSIPEVVNELSMTKNLDFL